MTFSMTLRNRPDTEDVIVLGSLVATAFWLFAGLPLFYLYSGLGDQQMKDMTTTWVATVLIGFLGGSVVAWVMGRIHAWWSRPIITAHLVEGRGCYITTARTGPTTTHDARFLRLLIQNQGRSTIHNCKGYVINIAHTANGVKTLVQQEVLELNWSSGSAAPRSIPPSAFFYIDTASIDLIPGRHALSLGVSWTPNHYSHMLGFNAPAASFELLIRLTADNAAPIDRRVCFDFDSQWQDLRVQYDRGSRIGTPSH
ncbi:UNVERIFIED_ORG: hypothetical protein M2425_005835 [Bradyrhizobium japonicum]